jgi:hypothetical protein
MLEWCGRAKVAEQGIPDRPARSTWTDCAGAVTQSELLGDGRHNVLRVSGFLPGPRPSATVIGARLLQLLTVVNCNRIIPSLALQIYDGRSGTPVDVCLHPSALPGRGRCRMPRRYCHEARFRCHPALEGWVAVTHCIASKGNPPHSGAQDRKPLRRVTGTRPPFGRRHG